MTKDTKIGYGNIVIMLPYYMPC